jgi:hypothetical protein
MRCGDFDGMSLLKVREFRVCVSEITYLGHGIKIVNLHFHFSATQRLKIILLHESIQIDVQEQVFGLFLQYYFSHAHKSNIIIELKFQEPSKKEKLA